MKKIWSQPELEILSVGETMKFFPKDPKPPKDPGNPEDTIDPINPFDS
ncbi:paeninodin family lasso peptide [Bacillus alkalicellulosilyticus]|nr:paeninodin family lasso peptide [Bacillus alkalicellulosilyticus]